jgi:hypothetical protein
MALEKGASTSGLIKLDCSNYLKTHDGRHPLLQGFVSADCGREVTRRCHIRRMENAEPKGSRYDSIVDLGDQKIMKS